MLSSCLVVNSSTLPKSRSCRYGYVTKVYITEPCSLMSSDDLASIPDPRHACESLPAIPIARWRLSRTPRERLRRCRHRIWSSRSRAGSYADTHRIWPQPNTSVPSSEEPLPPSEL